MFCGIIYLYTIYTIFSMSTKANSMSTKANSMFAKADSLSPVKRLREGRLKDLGRAQASP